MTRPTIVIRPMPAMAGRRFRTTPASVTMAAVHADPPAAPIPRSSSSIADDRVRESLTGLLGIGDRLLVVGSCRRQPTLSSWLLPSIRISSSSIRVFRRTTAASDSSAGFAEKRRAFASWR